jgi:ABC-2 type transport system permease protein
MRIIGALWLRSLKTFVRNRVQLIITITIPFFFLYVFSAIFRQDNIEDPVNYMLAGIVITNVFQTSLSIASATITDIVSGFMKEILVSPVRRVQIALGQLLAAATIATMQGIIVVIIGVFIGLRFTSILTPLYAILVMILVGIVFSAFGLFLATLVKNAQTFQITEMAITMPLTFLCGAYMPLSLLPPGLLVAAYFNPMTYATAFFRTIILEKTNLSEAELIAEQLAFRFGSLTVTPLLSLLIIAVFGVIFLLLATFVFSRVDFSRINRNKMADNDIWA